MIVNATVCGVPAGDRGFHVHQWGDLSGADITTESGGHYNPSGQNHAGPKVTARHHGDLGNITLAYGIGTMLQRLDQISLRGASSIIGRSVIIHSSYDDGVTQPSGNSGVKVGACVIGLVDQFPTSEISCVTTFPPPGNYGSKITIEFISIVIVIMFAIVWN